MPSQFFGLNIGASALSSFQTSVNTTANNIANVQTKGYTRQTTTLQSTDPIRVYSRYGSTGTGVTATAITQERNLYYDTKYWQNSSSKGYYEQKLYYLYQVEDVIKDDSTQTGFTSIFSKMFAGLDTLKTKGEEVSVRNQFIHQAQSLCTYFNELSTNLTQMQEDANEEIKSSVETVNAISQKVAILNKEINIGDIVLSTDVLHHDMDATGFGYPKGQIPQMKDFSFPADKELRTLAEKICYQVNPDIHVYQGRIVSGDQFISDNGVKDAIIHNFGGFAVEMEGAAIGQAAYLNRIPFLIIRAISDKADGSASMDYPAFEAAAARHSLNLTLELIRCYE